MIVCVVYKNKDDRCDDIHNRVTKDVKHKMSRVLSVAIVTRTIILFMRYQMSVGCQFETQVLLILLKIIIIINM